MSVSKVETNEKKVRARNEEKQWGSIIVHRHTILLIWRHNLLANGPCVVLFGHPASLPPIGVQHGTTNPQ